MKKFVFLFFVFAFSIAIFSQFPDGKLHVVVCDVSQGDAILITKGYTQVVIDGGPNNQVVSCVNENIPFWDRKIELVVNTHADLDHYFGLIELLGRFEIKEFLGSAVESNAKQYSFLKDKIALNAIHQTSAKAGQTIEIGGVNLKVIFPTREFLNEHSKTARNDFSAIIYLKYGNFTGLFTGDTSPSSEAQMIRLKVVPHAYFLKVPHHGSKNGLTSEFLDYVDPKIAAISVGVKNRFGHPSPEVISMLKEKKVKILRTDQKGDIKITTDGTKVWVTD